MSGRKTFTAGEVLQAADVNDFLMDQSVMVFAGTAARGSAIPSPTEGMVTYLQDADELQVYTTVWEAVGQSAILQVVQDIKTDTEAISSSTFTAVSGLSASITPSSASNKVLVMATLYGTRSTVGATPSYRLTGGNAGTFIGAAGGASQPRAAASVQSNDNTSLAAVNIIFLDSPATTSSVTYGVEWQRGSGGTAYIGRTNDDANDINNARVSASITVMEVAG